MTQLPLINLCIHPGCGLLSRNRIKLGYCHKHYKRFKKHGDAAVKGRLKAFGAYCPLFLVRRSPATYWGTTIDGQTVLVHRIIMEKILDRKLDRNEHVHHEDGNGLYNHPDNMKVLWSYEHGKTSNGRK